MFLVSEISADDKVKKAAASVRDQYTALVDLAEQEGRSRELAAKFIDLASKHPKDPLAVDSLVWVVRNIRRGTEVSQAIALLATEHVKNEKLERVCQRLVRNPSRDSEKLLRLLLDKSPHKNVQAQACFHLAAYLKEQMRLSRSLKSEPGLEKRYQQFYGEDVTKHLVLLEEATVSKEIERLYDRITKSYADVNIEDGTMGQTAKKELFAIRHLSVGRKALEITGEDIDGKQFKLSDYRGKVVLLDFWGDW